MATFTELSKIVHSRFRDVPGFELTEAESLVEQAALVYGIADPVADTTDIQRVLTYASAEAALTIAVSTASYFSFTDGEESVDKSMVSEAYRELADNYRTQLTALDKTKQRQSVAKFGNVHRIDRPPFADSPRFPYGTPEGRNYRNRKRR